MEKRLVGFFADPFEHSLSPWIHNLGFDYYNISAHYMGFRVNNNNLKGAIESMRTLNMLGANISMPNKEKVLDYLDVITNASKRIGAVNTIVNTDGKLTGYSTDGDGFYLACVAKGIDFKDKTIVILGAGGSAKAIVNTLIDKEIRNIYIFKRKNASFDATQLYFESLSPVVKCVPYVEENLNLYIQDSDYCINATGIGMGSQLGKSPLSDDIKLHPKQMAIELIYSPRTTPFLEQAQRAGCKTLNGLDMLLHQGAIGFELWTHKKLPMDLVQKKIEQLIKEREVHL